jgi:hypothetical protein
LHIDAIHDMNTPTFAERTVHLGMVRKAALVLALALVMSCGDSLPTTIPPITTTTTQSPVIPAGTVLQIVSGADESPVAGAEVVVAGYPCQTNENGRVSLSQGCDRESLLDIVADGFLNRQTLLRTPDNTRFTLWPNESHSPTSLSERFTRELVYEWWNGTPRRMIRIDPTATEVYVVPSDQIRADTRAMATVNAAANNITEATRGELPFIVADIAPPGAAVFELVVDPNDPDLVDANAAGIAKRRLSGFAIVGGTAVFDSIERVRTSTTPHELGHLFGLGHTDGPVDMMSIRRGKVERFSRREELAMYLMLQRPPGNEFPDNDRNVMDPLALTTGEEWISVIP